MLVNSKVRLQESTAPQKNTDTHGVTILKKKDFSRKGFD